MLFLSSAVWRQSKAITLDDISIESVLASPLNTWDTIQMSVQRLQSSTNCTVQHSVLSGFNINMKKNDGTNYTNKKVFSFLVDKWVGLYSLSF